MAIDTSRQFTTLVRLGYAARGITYILLGYLALSTGGEARGGGKAVFDWLQDVPGGTVMLWLMALGLLAYAIFKFISAIGDIQHRGSDAKGVVKRVGDAASGIAHSILAYAAFQFATGEKSTGADGSSQEMAGSVLDTELGAVLVGLIGLGFLISAAMQAKQAVTAEFMRHVDSRAPAQVKPAGRAGHAARAVVFAIIGWSLVQSAWLSSSNQAKGLGEAIVSLRDAGFIYTLVAIGLLLFGVFSLVVARYRIIPDVSREDLKPSLR